MEKRGIHTQVVTSAFRRIPTEWLRFERLNVVVSIDGLQPEHDERRKPATYERILKSIAGSQVTIHCTITGNIATRPGYLDAFLRFWTPQPEIRKVWFSLFTPQRGATGPEILTAVQRREVMEELFRLRVLYPSLDMPESVIREISDGRSEIDAAVEPGLDRVLVGGLDVSEMAGLQGAEMRIHERSGHELSLVRGPGELQLFPANQHCEKNDCCRG